MHGVEAAGDENAAEIQEALIKSEEMRLALAKTLVEAQLDMNDRESQWSTERLELEKRLADLEGGHFEQAVSRQDYASIAESRDDVNGQLLRAKDDLIRREFRV